MRAMVLVLLVICSGCKTAEFALTHPTTGMHLVARIEAKDAAEISSSSATAKAPSQAASDEAKENRVSSKETLR